ncbi:MAG: twin transmembrane helix small protein [Alphaproteobacteria bacterium]
MTSFSIIAMVLACIAVLGALGVGLFSMAKGGEFNKQYGNKLMQARVMFQGLALALLALAYFSSQG